MLWGGSVQSIEGNTPLYSSQTYALAFVPNITIETFGTLADEPQTFDDAIGGPGKEIFVAQVGLNVLMACADGLFQAPVLSDEPEGAVVVYFEDDVYSFQSFGGTRRYRQIADGHDIYGEGEPLALETVFEEISDPESSHLEFLCRVAGIPRDELRRLDWYALTPRWKKRLSRLFGR